MITPETLGYGKVNFNDRMKALSNSSKQFDNWKQFKTYSTKPRSQAEFFSTWQQAHTQSANKSGVVYGSFGTGGLDSAFDKQYTSDIRDRQKNRGMRNTNWQDFLIRPGMVGIHKPDQNSMALQEAYKTAETDTTGFSAKDQRDPNYAKKFAALELESGGKMLDVDLRDMFKETKVASDIGLVRRKPRLGYL